MSVTTSAIDATSALADGVAVALLDGLTTSALGEGVAAVVVLPQAAIPAVAAHMATAITTRMTLLMLTSPIEPTVAHVFRVQRYLGCTTNGLLRISSPTVVRSP